MSSRSAFIVSRPPVLVHLLQRCLFWCDFVLPSAVVQPGCRVRAELGTIMHEVVCLTADGRRDVLCRGLLARRLEGFTCLLFALLDRIDLPECIKCTWL